MKVYDIVLAQKLSNTNLPFDGALRLFTYQLDLSRAQRNLTTEEVFALCQLLIEHYKESTIQKNPAFLQLLILFGLQILSTMHSSALLTEMPQEKRIKFLESKTPYLSNTQGLLKLLDIIKQTDIINQTFKQAKNSFLKINNDKKNWWFNYILLMPFFDEDYKAYLINHKNKIQDLITAFVILDTCNLLSEDIKTYLLNNINNIENIYAILFYCIKENIITQDLINLIKKWPKQSDILLDYIKLACQIDIRTESLYQMLYGWNEIKEIDLALGHLLKELRLFSLPNCKMLHDHLKPLTLIPALAFYSVKNPSKQFSQIIFDLICKHPNNASDIVRLHYYLKKYKQSNQTEEQYLLSQCKYADCIEDAIGSLVKANKASQENIEKLLAEPRKALQQAKELGGNFIGKDLRIQSFTNIYYGCLFFAAPYARQNRPLSLNESHLPLEILERICYCCGNGSLGSDVEMEIASDMLSSNLSKTNLG